MSISTNRLLDIMDFNSNQNIVYSACDTLILFCLVVEDSEYVIPKIGGGEPPRHQRSEEVVLKGR